MYAVVARTDADRHTFLGLIAGEKTAAVEQWLDDDQEMTPHKMERMKQRQENKKDHVNYKQFHLVKMFIVSRYA